MTTTTETNQIFTVGQKFTIISISDALANTVKREGLVSSAFAEPEAKLHYSNGPIDAYRFGGYRLRGKRKDFYLDVPLGALVFEGWDLPILIDAEAPEYFGFAGNACINLSVKPEMFADHDDAERRRLITIFLRAFIDEKNLNPNLTDRDKAAIVLIGKSVHDEGTLVYPELETSHAVVERMKEKLNAAA